MYFHHYYPLLKVGEKVYETEVQDINIYYYYYEYYNYYMMHLDLIPDFVVHNENEKGHEIRVIVHVAHVEEMVRVEQYLEKVL